jgi:hypothetical protein
MIAINTNVVVVTMMRTRRKKRRTNATILIADALPLVLDLEMTRETESTWLSLAIKTITGRAMAWVSLSRVIADHLNSRTQRMEADATTKMRKKWMTRKRTKRRRNTRTVISEQGREEE